MNYHNMSKAQIYRLLDTCENGLSENEAAKRLKKYGLNQLSSPKKKNILLRFLMQFNDFMTLILIGSAIISLVISFLNNETDFIEPIIIMSIVCLNGFIGVVQESKAEAAIESLKKEGFNAWMKQNYHVRFMMILHLLQMLKSFVWSCV